MITMPYLYDEEIKHALFIPFVGLVLLYGMFFADLRISTSYTYIQISYDFFKLGKTR